MLRLEDREWKAFALTGRGGLFQMRASASRIDASRLKVGEDRTLPYVTRTDSQNGVKDFVSISNSENGLEFGRCLTVGLDTLTVFWQEFPFITGQSVQILTGPFLNRYTALFIRPLLMKQLEGLSWGHGASQKRLKRVKLLLPITNDGNPDYQFMEDYIRQMIGTKV